MSEISENRRSRRLYEMLHMTACLPIGPLVESQCENETDLN